jgi:ABC-type dipeptide/oligopeptide/nickel transport system permease subunit
MRRLATVGLVAGATLIFPGLGVVLVAGNTQPVKWSQTIWIEGRDPRNGAFVRPPFPVMTYAEVFDERGVSGGTHLFVLGSDAAGRDMLGLLGRGMIPSLLLVALVVLARIVVGIIAGLFMASGVQIVSAISRGMGRWVAGFPYLALAIVVVQALSPTPTQRTLAAFVLGMALVGWRDVAEITARVTEGVRVSAYSEAAKALGSTGFTYFRRHLVPHLRPALAAELPFQASAVLVLLGELGFLGVYLGGTGIRLIYDTAGGRGPNVAGHVLPPHPDLAELLSDARDYILQQQWGPVLIPALTIALLALAFEVIGIALRLRATRKLA